MFKGLIFMLCLGLCALLYGSGSALKPESGLKVEKPRLAVGEVQVKGGAVNPNEAVGLGDVLEAKINDSYIVITRAALKPIMAEIGLQTSSGLVDQREAQVELGKLKGVRYLLIPSISKLGSKLYLNLAVADCSTGEIDPSKKISVSGANFEQLLEHLDDAMLKIGIGIDPNAGHTGKFAVASFSVAKDVILDGGVAASKFQSKLMKGTRFEFLERQAVDKILKEHQFARIAEAAPDQYSRLGQLLSADYIVCGEVSRFRNEEMKVDNTLTGGGTSTRYVGRCEIVVKIIRVKDGVALFSDTLSANLRKSDIPVSERRDWVARDYADALLDRTLDAALKAVQGCEKLK